MADIYCCHFEYGGVSSRTYGLHFVNVGTERFINIQGQISGVNIFNKRSKRNYLVDTDYSSSPISYDIDIVTDDERTLNILEQKEIERWLFNRAKNMKLYIDPEDDTDYGTFDKYQIVTSRPASNQEVGVVYLVRSSGTTYTAKRWNGEAYEDMPNVIIPASGTTMTEASGSHTITSEFERMDGNQNIIVAHRRYLRCRFINPEKLEYNGGIVGYKVTLEADTGYWIEDPITYTYTLSQGIDATSNISLTPNTDTDTYIYPSVSITSGNVAATSTGAKTSTVTTTASSGTKYYRCVVTSGGTSINTNATAVTGYNIAASPYVYIVKQPVNTIGFIGYPVTFSIQAVGNGLSYQWQKKKQSAGSSAWENLGVAGDTSPTVTFNMTYTYEESNIRCVVTDMNDHSVTSNAVTLDKNVDGSTLTDGTSFIQKNPGDVTARPGDRVSFSVEAYGENITYQWQVSKNNGSTWSDCSGEGGRNIIYGFEAVSGNNGWKFRCKVSGNIHYMEPSSDPGEAPYDVGPIPKTFTSSAATLTVVSSDTPIIVTQPTPIYTIVNGMVSLTADVAGNDLTYQWQVSNNGTTGWTNVGSTTVTLVNQTDSSSRLTELTDMPGSTTIVIDGETNYVGGDYYKILGSRHFPRILPFTTNTFTVMGPVSTISFEVENRRNL